MNTQNFDRNEIYAVISLGDSYISAMLASKNGTKIVPLFIESYPTNSVLSHGRIQNIAAIRIKLDEVVNIFKQEIKKRLNKDTKLTNVYIGLNPMTLSIQEFEEEIDLGNEMPISNSILTDLSNKLEAKFTSSLNATSDKYLSIGSSADIYYINGNKTSPKSRNNVFHIPAKKLSLKQKHICIRQSYLQCLKDIISNNPTLKEIKFRYVANPIAEAKLINNEGFQNNTYIRLGAGSTSVLKDPTGNNINLLNIPLGANNITIDLATNYNLNLQTAERQKCTECAIDLQLIKNFTEINTREDIERYNLNALLYSRSIEILHHALTIVEHFSSEEMLSRVIFYGGGLKMKGLQELIQEIFAQYDINIYNKLDDLFQDIIEDNCNVYALNQASSHQTNEDQLLTLLSLVHNAPTISIDPNDLFNVPEEVVKQKEETYETAQEEDIFDPTTSTKEQYEEMIVHVDAPAKEVERTETEKREKSSKTNLLTGIFSVFSNNDKRDEDEDKASPEPIKEVEEPKVTKKGHFDANDL